MRLSSVVITASAIYWQLSALAGFIITLVCFMKWWGFVGLVAAFILIPSVFVLPIIYAVQEGVTPAFFALVALWLSSGAAFGFAALLAHKSEAA